MPRTPLRLGDASRIGRQRTSASAPSPWSLLALVLLSSLPLQRTHARTLAQAGAELHCALCAGLTPASPASLRRDAYSATAPVYVRWQQGTVVGTRTSDAIAAQSPNLDYLHSSQRRASRRESATEISLESSTSSTGVFCEHARNTRTCRSARGTSLKGFTHVIGLRCCCLAPQYLWLQGPPSLPPAWSPRRSTHWAL